MAECEFCDAVFEDEEELHLHWGDAHEDELNSHQRETMKKARRQRERRVQREEERAHRRKELAVYAVIGVLGLLVVGAIGSQLVRVHASESPTSGTTAAAGEPFNISGEPVLGDPDAPVTVVEFADFRCPFCRRFDTNVVPRLQQQFVATGKVRFVFMQFSFLGKGSTQAAVATECVYRQEPDQFWPYKETIFQHQGPEHERWVTQAKLMDWARSSTEGLNYSRLRQCIADQETLAEVREDRQVGRRHGVEGTPTVFVDGRKSPTFRFQAVKQLIDQQLQ